MNAYHLAGKMRHIGSKLQARGKRQEARGKRQEAKADSKCHEAVAGMHNRGMGAIRSFRDLIVWSKSVDLSAEVILLVRNFPSTERFTPGSQMIRAAVSISSNVAEGYGRGTPADYAKFVRIARGSTNELDSQLEICQRIALIDLETTERLKDVCNQIRLMLYRLDLVLRIKK